MPTWPEIFGRLAVLVFCFAIGRCTAIRPSRVAIAIAAISAVFAYFYLHNFLAVFGLIYFVAWLAFLFGRGIRDY